MDGVRTPTPGDPDPRTGNDALTPTTPSNTKNPEIYTSADRAIQTDVIEPFSPEPAARGQGSAWCRGKNEYGVRVASTGPQHSASPRPPASS